jgi:hypothetical protein
MILSRLAALVGLASGGVELGRVVLGVGIEASPGWLLEPLLSGIVQVGVAVALGLRPSRRSLAAFLFVFAVASVWDGSKFLVGHRLVYLLPVAALAAGLAAWGGRRT